MNGDAPYDPTKKPTTSKILNNSSSSSNNNNNNKKTKGDNKNSRKQGIIFKRMKIRNVNYRKNMILKHVRELDPKGLLKLVNLNQYLPIMKINDARILVQ